MTGMGVIMPAETLTPITPRKREVSAMSDNEVNALLNQMLSK